jgi:hypothetical protein
MTAKLVTVVCVFAVAQIACNAPPPNPPVQKQEAPAKEIATIATNRQMDAVFQKGPGPEQCDGVLLPQIVTETATASVRVAWLETINEET